MGHLLVDITTAVRMKTKKSLDLVTADLFIHNIVWFFRLIKTGLKSSTTYMMINKLLLAANTMFA